MKLSVFLTMVMAGGLVFGMQLQGAVKAPKIPVGSTFYQVDAVDVKQYNPGLDYRIYNPVFIILGKDTGLDLRKQIAKLSGVSLENQRLMFAGHDISGKDNKLIDKNMGYTHLYLISATPPKLFSADKSPKKELIIIPFDEHYGTIDHKGEKDTYVRYRSVRLDEPTVSTGVAEDNIKIIDQLKNLKDFKNQFQLYFLDRIGAIENPELFQLTLDGNFLDIAQVLYNPLEEKKVLKKATWIPAPPAGPAPAPKGEPPAYKSASSYEVIDPSCPPPPYGEQSGEPPAYKSASSYEATEPSCPPPPYGEKSYE